MPHSHADPLAPEFLVRVAGADLPAPAAADMLHVSVYEDLEAPAMFACELLNWDPDKAVMKWSDGNTFKEGSELEVHLGYRDHLATLIVGEITALEVSAASSDVPRLTVQGFDRSHRLMRDRRVRTFADMTDADIARRVANEWGLTPRITATGERHAYVLQCNQTDLEFLHERARRVGFEVIVRDKTLTFRPAPIGHRGPATLHREVDLLEFRSRLSTLAPTPRATARAWNPRQKQSIVGRADADDAIATMGRTK
ncbi:MAG TPA: contractile injection system protein, VgrG/Pvc8 family, partial [Vicinamibacterales bacterium]|nr:contractile injection system protein, VgrG/Pvc8 family [Vicinamibacterales bacterium]